MQLYILLVRWIPGTDKCSAWMHTCTIVATCQITTSNHSNAILGHIHLGNMDHLMFLIKTLRNDFDMNVTMTCVAMENQSISEEKKFLSSSVKIDGNIEFTLLCQRLTTVI